jgi:sporulation protein YlmC with PRC-barrel domain
LGNELGTVIDVLFDPVSGIVEALAVAGRQIPADALVGAGSYAVVIDASQDTD